MAGPSLLPVLPRPWWARACRQPGLRDPHLLPTRPFQHRDPSTGIQLEFRRSELPPGGEGAATATPLTTKDSFFLQHHLTSIKLEEKETLRAQPCSKHTEPW